MSDSGERQQVVLLPCLRWSLAPGTSFNGPGASRARRCRCSRAPDASRSRATRFQLARASVRWPRRLHHRFSDVAGVLGATSSRSSAKCKMRLCTLPWRFLPGRRPAPSGLSVSVSVRDGPFATRPHLTSTPFFLLPQHSRSTRGVPRPPPRSSCSFKSSPFSKGLRVGTLVPPPCPAQTVSDVFASAYVAQRGRNMQDLLDHLVLGVLRVRPASHPSASRLECVRV